MAWIAPTIAAVAALGSAAINSSRSNTQATDQSSISNQALAQAQSNAQQQAMIQALINKRSVAGTTDQAGTTLRYDPATNQWVSQLGKLPEQAQTSADQATVSRNTTDLRQAQAANAQAALRASRGEGYADTTRRELENFRPTSGSQMAGLLGEQATRANTAAYSPLIADTLRSFARTGTSAGPVLAQLGKSSASSLRDSLIDAQLKGTSSADTSNQSRRADLASAAQSGASLATPGFGYSQISPSTYSSTMAGLVGQRATGAATAPAYGASATNEAQKQTQSAYGAAAKAVPDPNYGTAQTQSALDSLSTAAGKGGALTALLDAYTGKKTNTNNTTYATDPTMSSYSFGGKGTIGDYEMYPVG